MDSPAALQVCGQRVGCCSGSAAVAWTFVLLLNCFGEGGAYCLLLCQRACASGFASLALVLPALLEPQLKRKRSWRILSAGSQLPMVVRFFLWGAGWAFAGS